MEAITRSPIYSQFGETISGAPTIRAYNARQKFIGESERRVDYNQMCYYPTFVSSRWLTVRLETTGNFIILFASLFAVLSKDYGNINAGDVGLSLSYALNVTGSMNMLVRMTSEVETNMVSAERIFEYQETPQEAPAEIENDTLPRHWPEHGVVKFDRYSTRYREGLDLVIKGVSFETMSSEKLGIVGRTGAGKSSLTLSLFRLIEAAGGEISKKFAQKAAKNCLVIDNSSYYRMDPEVPLIVPQVNSDDLKNINKNIIANPNCSTIQLVIALKPLHDLFAIKRIVVSTYQSVSGGGKAPMDELIEQTKLVLDNKKVKSKNFTKQIAFNVIPHIDVFSDDGYTKEELKMTNETKKILDDKINLTATCVRLPVLVSHSESVNIEFEKPYSLEKVREALDNFEGCKVIDDRTDGGYSTPLEAEGKVETFISRIREDKTIKNGLNLWIVSDNLLRGAALNAVEIAEVLIKNNFYGK